MAHTHPRMARTSYSTADGSPDARRGRLSVTTGRMLYHRYFRVAPGPLSMSLQRCTNLIHSGVIPAKDPPHYVAATGSLHLHRDSEAEDHFHPPRVSTAGP